MPSAVKAWNPNHWATWEYSCYCLCVTFLIFFLDSFARKFFFLSERMRFSVSWFSLYLFSIYYFLPSSLEWSQFKKDSSPPSPGAACTQWRRRVQAEAFIHTTSEPTFSLCLILPPSLLFHRCRSQQRSVIYFQHSNLIAESVSQEPNM